MISFANSSRVSKIIIIVTSLLILLSIPIALILVRQRQEIRKKAIEGGDGQLVCDSGTDTTNPQFDPYNSVEIRVTNKTGQRIERLVSNIFRCQYEPGLLPDRRGYFYCDSSCDPQTNPDCRVGVWDQPALRIVPIDPNQTVTFTMTVNNCEIAQLDAYNEAAWGSYVDSNPNDPRACYNVRSNFTNPTPPARWPKGIAFAISQNSTGYIDGVGCPAPTATPTPTITPTGVPPTPTGTLVPTPTTTAIPSPTIGGLPTNTPTPTRTPTPTPTRTPTPTPTRTPTPTPSRTPTPKPTNTPVPTAPPGSTPTPTTPPPVSGNINPTIVTIIGGGILILVGLLL